MCENELHVVLECVSSDLLLYNNYCSLLHIKPTFPENTVHMTSYTLCIYLPRFFMVQKACKLHLLYSELSCDFFNIVHTSEHEVRHSTLL